MTGGWTFPGNKIDLIVTIKVNLVRAIAELLTALQFLGDVWITGGGNKGGKPIKSGDEAIVSARKDSMAALISASGAPDCALTLESQLPGIRTRHKKERSCNCRPSLDELARAI